MPTKISGTSGVDRVQDDTLVIADAKAGQAVGFNRMQLFAAKATTSGTRVDFSPVDGTGIPSWAKRITLTLNGVSTNGTSYFAVLVGNSGGVVSTGYGCTVVNAAAGSGSQVSSTATEHALFALSTTATGIHNATVTLVSTEAGKWQISSTLSIVGGTSVCLSHSAISISGLDRIRLTTANGTDQFDAGSVNILVEGYE